MRVFARSLVSTFLSSHSIFAGEWKPHLLVYPLGHGRVRETLDVPDKEQGPNNAGNERTDRGGHTAAHYGQRHLPLGEKVKMPCFEKWRRVNCPSWWTAKAWSLW